MKVHNAKIPEKKNTQTSRRRAFITDIRNMTKFRSKQIPFIKLCSHTIQLHRFLYMAREFVSVALNRIIEHIYYTVIDKLHT